GIDTEEWNPATDPHLAAHFDVHDLAGKARCKAALQQEAGLPVRPEVPLLALVARLVPQKGVDVFAHALDTILGWDVQLIMLGSGDREAERFFSSRARLLDHVLPIDDRAGRNVAIGIAGVLARGCPGPVELALLDEEHEGPLGVLSAPDGGFAGGDLVERAAEMNGRRLQAAGISPRDRPVERPVDLEGAGAVAVAPEPAHIARGQDRCADVGE